VAILPRLATPGIRLAVLRYRVLAARRPKSYPSAAVPNTPPLAEVLWIAPILVHLYTIWHMAKKNLISSYPLFVFYCGLQVIRLFALYPLYVNYSHHKWAYFYGFWTFEAFDVIVSIAIIREIYVRLFVPYPAICKLGCALFNWAIAVLFLVASYAALTSHDANTWPFGRYVVAFDQSATIIRAGLILLLICIGLFFHIEWQKLNFGIALGFFLFLMVNMAALAIILQYGGEAQHLYARLRAAGYNVGAIMWAWYVVRKPAEESKPYPFTNCDLARWNAELAGLLR
jgi:hypothetical protein